MSLAGPPDTPDYWRMYKFNAVTWEKLGMVDIPLDNTQELSDGPTMSFINGMITVSGEYFPGGTPDGPLGRGSHHHFVTPDLQLRREKIMVCPGVPSHCPESSLRQLPNGDIIMFTASLYFGDLVVLRLDKDWNFIDEHVLRSNAFFPIGAVANGDYWYVAYYDTSKGREPGEIPYRNVGLAAFDATWNLIQDEKGTDFDVVPEGENFTEGEGCWVELLGNRLYVSYDVTEFKAGEGGVGSILGSHTYVNVYELNQNP